MKLNQLRIVVDEREKKSGIPNLLKSIGINLEIKTLPGMTSTSLLPKAAKAAGLEFPDLIDTIIKIASINK